MRKHAILFGLLALFALTASAEVKLPHILSSNMVLQQQTDVKLWGKASAGKKVKVTPSWDTKTYTATADAEGRWLLTVPTPAAGGPYDIRISDGEEVVLHDVLIGEVWFCSGQSNMEMPLRGFGAQPVEGVNDLFARADAATPIRAFTAAYEYGKTPLEDIKGEWTQHTGEQIQKWSATAYFFGRYLQEVLDVPVGLVISSWGGSKIEAWMSEDMFGDFPEFDVSYLKNDERPATPNHHTPCYLYNTKVHPFLNYTIKGSIWYQGESNRDKPEQYARLLPALVKNWRDKWGLGEFPFYYVQIAPFVYDGADGTQSARLREVQLQCMREIPNSGMAVTLDIGNEKCIHPEKKREVGERLAYWALAKTYGRKGFGYCAPVYKSMEVKDGKVYVSFEKASPMGIAPMGKDLKHIEVAGEDRVFYPAKAYIDSRSGQVVASSEQVPAPVAVRYAYKNYVQGDIFDAYGLPVSSFRSDDW